MGPREKIEDFLRRWRSRYEGSWVFRVLAVAVAILLALLVLRRLRVLTVPVLIGAILVAGWLLVGSSLTIPRFTTEGPVVRNGVAAVVVCGKKSGSMNEKGMMAVSEQAPEPRTGGWWPARRGECTVWYHRPPGLEQRFNRHQRAQREQTSVDRNDLVKACGREVLAEYQELAEYRDIAGDIARGMRKDCGIYGPQAAMAACGTKRDLAAVLKRIPEPATGTWGTQPRSTCRVQYPHPPDRWQSA